MPWLPNIVTKARFLSSGMQEPSGSGPKAAANLSAVPNPFVSSVRIPGHEAARFELFDAAGETRGIYPGNRIGGDLPPAVYFVRLVGERGPRLRVVKIR